MHASLTELLENLKPGLLWVAAVGVRDSERGATSDLRCRVIPGLASDDAFVLIGHDVTHDARAGYDNLVQVIRSDVRDPLRDAQAALAVWESQGSGRPELATDRIELWPLLQRAWGGVEPQALQRSVKVRLRAQTEAGALAPCTAANTGSDASSRNARKPLSAARDGDLPRLRRLRASCVAAPWPAARGSRRRCAQLPHRAAHRCAAPQRPEPARRGPGPVLRHRPGRADVSGPHPRHAPLAPSRSPDHPRSFVRSTP